MEVGRLKIFLLFIFITLTTSIFAQEDEEYKMDVGVKMGLLSYIGDFNGNPFKGGQPAYGLVLTRMFNPYTALRLSITKGTIKGNSSNAKTYYPNYTNGVYSFKRNILDIGLVYEYNFWPYGTGRDYKGTKRLVPFVFGGIGITSVTGGDTKNITTANIPLGLGMKYKATDRLNVILSWQMHFTMSDKLDGVSDPYTVRSSGLFKNKDAYSQLSLSLTYSFMPKCKTCNKDD